MKTVIMTGATGFLGRHTLNGLLNKGYLVYALVRKESKLIQNLPLAPNLKLIYGSLEELNIISDYVQYAECFIHFAWSGSDYISRADKTIQQKNIECSMKALKIAEQIGCSQFIFAGSQAEYGIVHEEINENTKCDPVSEYAKAKLRFSELAKNFCADIELQFIHLRIFSVYGVGDGKETLVNMCIKKFNYGGTIILGPCLQNWNYLNVTDFVYMLMKIIESHVSDGVYNVASKDTRIMREFVSEIYKLSNKCGTYQYTEIAKNPEKSPSLNPNTDRIMKLIGEHRMVPFETGIKEIMDTLKEEKV